MPETKSRSKRSKTRMTTAPNARERAAGASRNDDRRPPAPVATIRRSASHAIADMFVLHATCENRNCRRTQRCSDQAAPCFAKFWPLLDERDKIWVRAALEAKAKGGGLAELRAACDAALARWDALEAAELRRAEQARQQQDAVSRPPLPQPRIRSL